MVRYDTINPAYRQHIQTDGICAAVGANGLPLDIIGRVKLPVRLGEFRWDQEFTVVKNITVACLLGADFLIKHGVIVDCKSGRLSLGQVHVHLPITMGSACGIPNIDLDDHHLSVRMADTTEVPARSILLIWAKLEGAQKVPAIQEGLIEPVYYSNSPKHIMVARSMSGVRCDGRVLLQIMNISPDMVRIHKGTKLGEFTPVQHVHIIDEQEMFMPNEQQTTVDIQSVDLSTSVEDHKDV